MRRPRLARGGICLSRLWRCYERDHDRLAAAIQAARGQDGTGIPLAYTSAEGRSHQSAQLDMLPPTVLPDRGTGVNGQKPMARRAPEAAHKGVWGYSADRTIPGERLARVVRLGGGPGSA